MLHSQDPWALPVAKTKEALEENVGAHWILGFSGGKDSTALLKVFCRAIALADRLPTQIDVIYCDTGVENPVLDRYVKVLFADLVKEFEERKSPLKCKLIMAPVNERFFVRIIGRGYPPPTNTFRWCTKGLRIKPVARFITDAARGDAIVALGLRRSESEQRKRSIRKNGDGIWQQQIEGGRKYRVFLPILDLSVSDVWEAIFFMRTPSSVDNQKLAELYRGASGECPIVKSPLAPPCATGRFGCWTCTVVRKDKSAISLIKSGHEDLVPFLDFRDWLLTIRNDPDRRWSIRRNGTKGKTLFFSFNRRDCYQRKWGQRLTAKIIFKNRAQKRFSFLLRLSTSVARGVDANTLVV